MIFIFIFRPRHTNRFSVDVNVAGESKVTFNLTYQELLERVYGEYEHIIYIDPGQIIEDFQIDVSIQESRYMASNNTSSKNKKLLIMFSIVDIPFKN
jgi:hypothetical protein